MNNWSFKKNNNKPGEVHTVNPLDLLLFNKFLSSEKYRKLAKNITWDDFTKFNFEDPIVSGGNGLKRYLTFVCYDMYGITVSLRFIIDKTTHEVIQTIYLELAITNRKVTSKIYVDDFHLAGNKSTDPRLYAHLWKKIPQLLLRNFHLKNIFYKKYLTHSQKIIEYLYLHKLCVIKNLTKNYENY